VAPFDAFKDRISDIGDEAEDATVSSEDLQKSEDELLAELDEELEQIEEDEESEPVETETAEAETAEAQTVEPVQEETTEPDTSPEPTGDLEAEVTEPDTGSPTSTETTTESESQPEGAPGKYQIDPERVEDLLWDLELVLLEADVATDVAKQLRDEMEDRLPRIRVDSKSEVPQAVERELRKAIRGLLEGGKFDFDEWVLMQDETPATVMFVGVNGTGKTTTIARIAHRVKGLGFSSVLAAGDTYRAGAIKQLEEHGDNLGQRVISHGPGDDAAAVVYDAIDHAEARKKDLVLVDTAGRMQTDSNLMDELSKIGRVAEPDLTVFVGDSLTGNDAIEQAKEFDKAVGVDAVVLTKVDTDAKGGAALSISQALGKPVAYLGVGENYDDLIPFEPDWLIERIFGDE